jgi:predicted transcriptional regulator
MATTTTTLLDRELEELFALYRACGHRLRIRILLAMIAGGSEVSPNYLAQMLGEPLGNVSYHVLILERLGAIRKTREAPVRGAIEHFYTETPGIRVVLLPITRHVRG